MTTTQQDRRVAIVGGTGRIGTHLVPAVLAAGWHVVLFSRQQRSASQDPRVRYAQTPVDWSVWQGDELNDCQAVINLAGAAIDDGRWSNSRREELRHSRLAPTLALAQQVHDRQLRVLINSSGIAAYANAGATAQQDFSPCSDEQSALSGEGFLADLVRDWEQAAAVAGDRAVMLRLPLVLLPLAQGGGLKKMLPRLGPIRPPLVHIGSGQQPLPWVHVSDVVTVILMALEQPHWRGPINIVAPELLSNKLFTVKLAHTAGRWRLPIGMPGLLLRLMLGPAAQLATHGQAVQSQRLQEWGYQWQYDQLADALVACQVS